MCIHIGQRFMVSYEVVLRHGHEARRADLRQSSGRRIRRCESFYDPDNPTEEPGEVVFCRGRGRMRPAQTPLGGVLVFLIFGKSGGKSRVGRRGRDGVRWWGVIARRRERGLGGVAGRRHCGGCVYGE